jgi:hypothetical protein
VEKIVRSCVLCNTSKIRNWNIGLYMPFPIPSMPRESISMDFVRGFPMNCRDHDYLFFIVDHFKNTCVLIPCKNMIFGQVVDELFVIHVWLHFRFPSSIISDRDRNFLGIFWTMIWERMNAKLRYSSTFHPILENKPRLSKKHWYSC